MFIHFVCICSIQKYLVLPKYLKYHVEPCMSMDGKYKKYQSDIIINAAIFQEKDKCIEVT